MSYCRDARGYVDKLVSLQQHIIRKYPDNNHKTMINTIQQIKVGFDIYNTRTDTGMRRYWIRFREAIMYMVPTNAHPGYATLRKEFESLDQVELWNSVSMSLK